RGAQICFSGNTSQNNSRAGVTRQKDCDSNRRTMTGDARSRAVVRRGSPMKFGVKRTLALAALMTGAAGVAHATEGWYVRGDVGQSLNTQYRNYDIQNGFVGDVGAGYTWDSGFRVEAELSYRKNKWSFIRQEQGDLIAWGLLANLFYDFNRHGTFR